MKILSLATTHPRFVGDSEPAYVSRINREIAELGHDVTTVVPHAAGAKRAEVVDGVRILRFRYFLPESRQNLCYGGGMLPNLKRSWWARINLPFFLTCQAVAVAREFRRERYDVVHCHWLVPNGFVGALFCRPRQVPLVVTAHGSDVFTDSALFRLANRYVLGVSSLCTANSYGSRDRVREIRDDVAIELLPMGVDVDAFHPDRASPAVRARLGGGEPQILFVGRFSENKGVRYLIEAMPMVLRQLPNARLAIIGFGPEEVAIRNAVEENHLHDAVTILGRAPRTDMPAYIASADLVVLPSVKIEGLGVVLLEALASGTPVVGALVGGIPDVIRDGETGLLCRQRDADDLAEKCVKLLTDEELRRTTARNGRRLVEERYSWTGIAQRFEALLRSCAAGASSRPSGGAP